MLEGRGSRGGADLIHLTENLVWLQGTGSGPHLEGLNIRSEGRRKGVLVARGTWGQECNQGTHMCTRVTSLVLGGWSPPETKPTSSMLTEWC